MIACMSAPARRKRALRNLEVGRHSKGTVIVMTKAKAVVTATAINLKFCRYVVTAIEPNACNSL